jgi:hypothetical protein
MPVTRFVILHHCERSGEHWDLMIEQGEALATWRLARLPKRGDLQPIPADRIADHRKAYLTYEGPLTRDRGTVTRVEEGTCEVLEQTGDCWRLMIYGRRLCSSYVLKRLSDDPGAGGLEGPHCAAGDIACGQWMLISA